MEHFVDQDELATATNTSIMTDDSFADIIQESDALTRSPRYKVIIVGPYHPFQTLLSLILATFWLEYKFFQEEGDGLADGCEGPALAETRTLSPSP